MELDLMTRFSTYPTAAEAEAAAEREAAAARLREELGREKAQASKTMTSFEQVRAWRWR